MFDYLLLFSYSLSISFVLYTFSFSVTLIFAFWRLLRTFVFIISGEVYGSDVDQPIHVSCLC